MFGKNQIVGTKYFDKAEDKLFVTSIFFTLQGEGPYRGEPAVFIRLAKCNLACGFCDSFFDDGDWLTIEEINNRIESTVNTYFGGNTPIWAKELWGGVAMPGQEHEIQVPLKPRDMVLVITGGEPMLQKNLGPLLEFMETRFSKTQIESNGTLVQKIPDSTTLVVSPKCFEKQGVAIKYLAPRDEMLERADCLKFVMSADLDSPYCTVPDWAHDFHRKDKPVFISPMNIYNDEPMKSKQLRASNNQITLAQRSTVDEKVSFWEPGLLNMEENQKNHEYTARYCIDHGFTFNMQLHLFASLA